MAVSMFSWTMDAGTFAAAGDNTVIAAPGAGRELGLKNFTLVNNGAADVTAIFKWGLKSFTFLLKKNCENSFSLGDAAQEEYWLGDNTALIVNLSAGSSCAWIGRWTTRNA